MKSESGFSLAMPALLEQSHWSTCTQIVFKRKTCLIEQSWCKCRKWNEELEEMWNGSWRRCMTSHDSRVWRPSRGRIRPMVGSGRLPWRGVYTFPRALRSCTPAQLSGDVAQRYCTQPSLHKSLNTGTLISFVWNIKDYPRCATSIIGIR